MRSPKGAPSRSHSRVRFVFCRQASRPAAFRRCAARLDATTAERRLRRIPDRHVGRLGAGRATYQTDRSALAQLACTAVGSGGGDVPVPERAIAFRSQTPIAKQALRNNCETAALSMLLAQACPRPAARVAAPASACPAERWAGRGVQGLPGANQAAGGWTQVTVRDLSGRAPGAIYRSLLQGRPVMAWVGLSDGPYRTWWTQAGQANSGQCPGQGI